MYKKHEKEINVLFFYPTGTKVKYNVLNHKCYIILFCCT